MQKMLLFMPLIVSSFCTARVVAQESPLLSAFSRSSTVVSKDHHKRSHEHTISLPAYAKAALTLAPGTLTEVGTIDPDSFIVVPLAINEEMKKHIDFNPDSHAFVIRHSGVYLVNFFLKFGGNTSSSLPGSAVMALRKT